jgi:hypothetical protein
LDEIRGSVTDVFCRSVIFGSIQLLQLLGALGTSKSNTSIATIGCSDQTSLSQVVLGLQVLDLGLIWSIYNANWYAEDGVTLERCVSKIPCTASVNSPRPSLG